MKEQQTLVKRHAFGVTGSIGNCIHWIDEHTLLYPVGKSVVLHNVKNNIQRFLEANVTCTGITAVAVSSNKKFVAFAESGSNPCIQLIDLVTRKRRKVLSVSDLGSDRFISLAFSADGRHLVSQGGSPAFNVYYWNWERTRPLATLSVSQLYYRNDIDANAEFVQNANLNSNAADILYVNHENTTVMRSNSPNRTNLPLVTAVHVCPSDPLLISISGVGMMHFYRYVDGILERQRSGHATQTGNSTQRGGGGGDGNINVAAARNKRVPVPFDESNEVFTCHTWIDSERVVASTQRGALYLYERQEFAGVITHPKCGSVSLYEHPPSQHHHQEEEEEEEKLEWNKSHETATESPEENETAAFATSLISTRNCGLVVGMDDGQVQWYHYHEEQMENCGYELMTSLTVPSAKYNIPTINSINTNNTQQSEDYASKHDAILTVLENANYGVNNNNKENYESEMNSNKNNIVGGGNAIKGIFNIKTHLSLTDQNEYNYMVNTNSTSTTTTNNNWTQSSSAVNNNKQITQTSNNKLSPQGNTLQSKTNKKSENDDVDRPTSMRRNSLFRFPYSITALSLDAREVTLAMTTFGNEIYGLPFQQVLQQQQQQQQQQQMIMHHNKDNNNNNNNNVHSASCQIEFVHLCQPFHTAAINGMSCSTRKPLLLTSSADHTVRIWNTATCREELCEHYELEPGAVALHPNGLMAVICFPDKVRVMSVLWNGLRERNTISFRNAHLVQFAHGGQFFAIAHGNLIDLYLSSTCEFFGQLRGHPQKIKSMTWCSTTPYPTDNRLVSCAADGMAINWDVTELRKEAYHVDKKFQYSAVASDDRHVWLIALPSTMIAMEVNWKVTLREMDRHCLNALHTTAEDYEFSLYALNDLTVAPHQRLLFASCDDGSLKLMNFPLQAGVQQEPLPAHSHSMTHLLVNFDETLLCTAGSDGSVIIWDIRDEHTAMPIPTLHNNITTSGANNGGNDVGKLNSTSHAGNTTNTTNSLHPALMLESNKAGVWSNTNEVFVTQQEVEERRIAIDSLKQQIDKLKTDLESEEKRKVHDQGTRLRERVEEYKSESATLSAEYATVWNVKAEHERAFVQIKRNKENESSHAVEELERRRQREVQSMEEECNELEYSLDQLKTHHGHLLVEMEETMGKERTARHDRLNDVLSQRQEMLQKLHDQVQRMKQTNAEVLHQVELDTDTETAEMCLGYQRTLDSLREQFLKKKGEGAIMRKNTLAISKEMNVREGEIALLDSAHLALQAQLTRCQHDIDQLHQDIEERDGVIAKKEKIIFTLKRDGQQLEKFKFVLDHTIRELKSQMDPKQHEMKQYNAKIKTADEKLESLHKSGITLLGNIDDLKVDIVRQQQQIKDGQHKLKVMESHLRRFEKDANEISETLQEPALLRATIDKLYKVHVKQRHGICGEESDPSIHTEFMQQLEHLTNSVGALRKKVNADQRRHKKELSDMMTENLQLIREIQSLRSTRHQLQVHLATDEKTRRIHGATRTSPSTLPLASSINLVNTVNDMNNGQASIITTNNNNNNKQQENNNKHADSTANTGVADAASLTQGTSVNDKFKKRKSFDKVDNVDVNDKEREEQLNIERELDEQDESCQVDKEHVENSEQTNQHSSVMMHSTALEDVIRAKLMSRPPEYDANKRQIDLLRAYIDSMQRTFASAMHSENAMSNADDSFKSMTDESFDHLDVNDYDEEENKIENTENNNLENYKESESITMV